MSPQVSFTLNEGVEIVNSIVKKHVSRWKDGLSDLQRICIPKILNLEDVFAINATDGGKSALFGIPVLVHLKISRNVALYPMFDVPICLDTIGVVVMPTKGLANNIVHVLNFHSLSRLIISLQGQATQRGFRTHCLCLYL
ncbi:hypothetical protein BT96DRAFT_1091438 [Gymnopus androsaceus JB14]|uniref:DEAD/DEAH-box helicase domain-containing protein n=1 Tax=Gymnopus androsaceus JB14 TaxID=1447944 RepID=A0A6A4GJ01_9AGAR|nr:hypothetical protein BT96DRAFT_1091438 [Gymnopus androsaceus JB14]